MPRSLSASSSRTSPPVRSSTVPPRTFQCGGGSSGSMSLKSSKKIVRSPGTNSMGVDFKSGWPPAAGAALGGAPSDCCGGADDSIVEFGAGAATDSTGAAEATGPALPGAFGVRDERSVESFESTESPIVAPAASWKLCPGAES